MCGFVYASQCGFYVTGNFLIKLMPGSQTTKIAHIPAGAISGPKRSTDHAQTWPKGSAKEQTITNSMHVLFMRDSC